MPLNVRWLLLVLLLLVAACSQGSPADSAPQVEEVPPSPYPDTPAPVEINTAVIDAPALVELYMLNELDGWGVSEAELLRTNDGGATWYNVTPEPIVETGFNVDTFVLDNDHAWMLSPDLQRFPNGGFLYFTRDGGLTWKSSSVPFSRGDLHFVDDENGWVLADLGMGMGSNAVAVYQTDDGGVTWGQTYTNDPNQADSGDSLPLSGIKSGLIARDMETAWVGGIVYAPGEAYLFRTDDGGRTWAPVTLTLPGGAENFELGIEDDQIEFVSARDGFLALRMAGDSTQTAIYVTDDGGETWTLTPSLLDGAGETEFLSAQEMIMYNGEQFLVTHDAGATWVTVSPDIVFGETFANLDFANAMTGWVITVDPTTNHRSLYKTTDGGTTWFPVIP